jgi:RNA polymerase sigma-70 factor, ECF subfamily
MHEPSGSADRPGRFETLYQDCYRPIFGYLLRRADGDLDTIADLTAEVFVVALRRQRAIPDPPDDRLWLYGVARRVLLGHQRSAARRGRLESRLRAHAEIGEQDCDAAEQARQRIRTAMDRLRPGDREALRLIAWDGLSHAEAAQVLGCSVNAVALRIHKARARLRESLSEPEPAVTRVVPVSTRSEA